MAQRRVRARIAASTMAHQHHRRASKGVAYWRGAAGDAFLGAADGVRDDIGMARGIVSRVVACLTAAKDEHIFVVFARRSCNAATMATSTRIKYDALWLGGDWLPQSGKSAAGAHQRFANNLVVLRSRSRDAARLPALRWLLAAQQHDQQHGRYGGGVWLAYSRSRMALTCRSFAGDRN